MPILAPRLAKCSHLTAMLGTLALLATEPAAAQAGADGEWTMPGNDYASTRYSTLNQVTAGNASRLRPVWTFSRECWPVTTTSRWW